MMCTSLYCETPPSFRLLSKFCVFDHYIHVSTKEKRLMREMNEKEGKGERAKNGVDCGTVASIMASLTSHCEGF